MNARFFMIVGIAVIIVGLDGVLFSFSSIHENCIFNLRLGHNIYADSYRPCEVVPVVASGGGTMVVIGTVVLILGVTEKMGIVQRK